MEDKHHMGVEHQKEERTEEEHHEIHKEKHHMDTQTSMEEGMNKQNIEEARRW